jgi:hypothetical protein
VVCDFAGGKAMKTKKIEKWFWWNEIDAAKEEFEGVFKSHDAGCGIIQPNFLIWHWDMGRDFAAYSYELLRRSEGSLNFRPYPKLNAEESQFLFRAFGSKKSRRVEAIVIRNLDPNRPLEPRRGYSIPTVWRLDAPEGSLIKSFRLFIRQERDEKKITATKKPGQTSKSPPWHYVEILHKANVEREKITADKRTVDPERTLRTVRKDAFDYLQTLKTQWKKETAENPNLRKCLWAELERLLKR